jgi:hypothetical protein
MKARLQLSLMRLANPRVIRLLVIGVLVALMLMASSSGVMAGTCPGGAASGGVSGCG